MATKPARSAVIAQRKAFFVLKLPMNATSSMTWRVT